MKTRLFLGLDGGQSGTTAVIGDQTGRILGRGTGGPCNHTAAAEGRARLESAVRDSVSCARGLAGLDASARFEVACLGMSGGPADKVSIIEAVLNADRILVTTDAAVALSGAVAGGQGTIVIAGTGSIALGRNHERLARAGGWGYIFGDEGSAFDIARQALRAALRMEEGWGPPTVLRQRILDSAGFDNANDALHAFYGVAWPRDRIARFAPLVDQAAQQGDAAAAEILNYASLQLATLAMCVRSQLWTAEDPVAIAFSGGVFRSPLVRDRFQSLMELEPGTTCGPARLGPAEGALLEAYRAASLTPTLSDERPASGDGR